LCGKDIRMVSPRIISQKTGRGERILPVSLEK
jgi:hypothetical protein